MKQLCIIAVVLLIALPGLGQKINLASSFKAGNAYFDGLHPLVISAEEKKSLKLKSHEGVITDADIFGTFLDYPVEEGSVKSVYLELYSAKYNELKAGVIVALFVDSSAIAYTINHLEFQENRRYMQKDSYLITIWSDDERENRQYTFDKLISYYTKKIGAVAITTFSQSVRVEAPRIVHDNLVSPMDDDTEAELEDRAYAYMQEKDYDKAVAAYHSVLKKNDRNSRAYFNLAWIYSQTKQNKEAIAIARIALNFVSQTRFYEFYRIIANNYTDLDSLYEGRLYYEQSLKMKSDESMTLYNYGYNRFKAKDYQRSITLFQQTLQLGFDSDGFVNDVYFYMGTAMSELGEMERSLPYFDTAISMSAYVTYYFNKAEAYSRLNKNEEGIKVCEEGILTNPQSALLYFKIHQLYAGLGNTASSAKNLQIAYRLDDADPDILMDMGVMYERENKVQQALEVYRKALKNSTFRPGIYSNMASIFAQNKMTIDSAEYYHKLSIRLLPDSFIPYLNYGNMLKDLERYDEAKNMYQRAFNLNPDNDVVIGNYAVVYAQSGAYDKAREMLDLGLKKFPEDFEMNALRSQIALQQDKDYIAAEQYADKAMKNLKPGKGKHTILSIRANARQMNGAYSNAIYDYLEIINSMSESSKKQNADIYSNIGYCYLYLQEYDKAQSYFEKCLSYTEEIDAAIGMVFLMYKTDNEKGLKQYKKIAKKIFPDIQMGAEGLKKLEAEGYHYSEDVYKVIELIF